MKQVTLNQVGYVVGGEALLNLWGGGQGTIEMNETTIDNLTIENILKSINDGGFGCESIEEADVIIYTLYEHGYTEYETGLHFSADTLFTITNRECDYRALAEEFKSKCGDNIRIKAY